MAKNLLKVHDVPTTLDEVVRHRVAHSMKPDIGHAQSTAQQMQVAGHVSS